MNNGAIAMINILSLEYDEMAAYYPDYVCLCDEVLVDTSDALEESDMSDVRLYELIETLFEELADPTPRGSWETWDSYKKVRDECRRMISSGECPRVDVPKGGPDDGPFSMYAPGGPASE